MPALNFSACFADKVAAGTKTKTIRAHRKDRRPIARSAQMIKLYTGMRTKACRLLGTGLVVCVERVVIHPDGIEFCPGTARVWFLRASTKPDLINREAQADGFKDWAEMRDWFAETYGLPFTGTQIEWRLSRPV